MNQDRFRKLVLLYLALIVAAGCSLLLPAGYSQSLSDALDNEPLPALLENVWLMLALILPLVLAALAGIYGLYTFKRWGRSLSLYSTLGGLILLPFFGLSLYSGIGGALFEASTMLWGAILALSYHSAVSSAFSANNAVPATREDARA